LREKRVERKEERVGRGKSGKRKECQDAEGGVPYGNTARFGVYGTIARDLPSESPSCW
jgi:hypothetical protein